MLLYSELISIFLCTLRTEQLQFLYDVYVIYILFVHVSAPNSYEHTAFSLYSVCQVFNSGLSG
jgi:hypothetical protein